ncbi:hypothetical protein F8S13_25615 [Chloroflexia bacterium SDU3-3]|nr:hypothetical protein F8S13_25615 [Chloroflexia bacterium SDU3-3]
MNRAVLISVQLQLGLGVQLHYLDPLEIALDCYQCRRTRRTVVLRQADGAAICTPKRHAFPAQLAAWHIGEPASPEIRLLVHYDYQPFADAKYPVDSTGAPSWARVNLTCVCPCCGEVSAASTQTNIARPWTQRCPCGYALYTDAAVMPRFTAVSLVPPARWCFLSAAFPMFFAPSRCSPFLFLAALVVRCDQHVVVIGWQIKIDAVSRRAQIAHS